MTLKADRKLRQRLFNAAYSGRAVETAFVLELLLQVLTKDNDKVTPQVVPTATDATYAIIDGHALIQSLGKPKD
ncbi:hypothetical protein DPMN_141952 [Dreissena polymorpha]|uniref:Uncharacterized protein n=1 Tax=Dreissena polymorpha TaxID=45954 RepID=A0A9D4GDL4_DREPO|nr:hypothetical protein DPMN_141952 [Dreissena polymorpha]